MPKKNCLLIQTDSRNFFTHKKNIKQLIEFSKTFGAEISIVKADNPEILTLEELAPAICNNTYNPDIKFEVLECKLPAKKQIKTKLVKPAPQIREYVRACFLEGKLVELHSVARKFKNYQFTVACFCKHISQVRQELIKNGHQIEKIGGGRYQLKH